MIFVGEREGIADPPGVDEIFSPPLVTEEEQIPDQKWSETSNQEQDAAD
jgi:hypothetical protein